MILEGVEDKYCRTMRSDRRRYAALWMAWILRIHMQLVLQGGEWSAVGPELLILAVWFTLPFVAALRTFRWQ